METLKDFNLNLIKGKEWYHQRFDGCPLFISFIAEAEVKKEKRKPKGTEADVRLCFFEDNKADWYLDMKDVRRGARAIVELAKRDGKISKKLLNAWEKDEVKYQQFFKRFEKLDFGKLSISGLSKLWREYHRLAINRLTSSSIIDHFALGTDQMISDMFRKETKGVFSRESEFSSAFSVATAPIYQSFINLAEIDLLKIIVGKSKESLEHYQQRYYWTKNNYFSALELSMKDFKKNIKSWKASGKDLNKEIVRIEQTPVNNKIEKAKLFKKIELSHLLKALIKISEDFTWWQDERKRATYWNIQMGSRILAEISKRTPYTVDELKFATPSEMDDILKSNRSGKKELVQRKQKCAIVATEKGYFIAVGRKFDVIKKNIAGAGDLKDVKDFRGLSASVGKAQGTVKIVKSATEISKIKTGDILVAVMTRPDYVTGMKKAAAIVTNEGGITSHAAIVARELGIPCIIGTKIATEVLKDGDQVEVNANHGWVRKLQ